MSQTSLTRQEIAELPFVKRSRRLSPDLDDIFYGDSCPLIVRQFAIDDLHRLSTSCSGQELAINLRVQRHHFYACTLLAELLGLENIIESASSISSFADLMIHKAFQLEANRLVEKGKLPPVFEDLGQSGLIILAMGKLGAQELNFSSDVDLVVFFDAHQAGLADEFPTFQRHLIKLVQDVARLLSDNNEAGFAYRVDLRLRPDPGATAVVISTDAAELYYEQLGQNWERAAFIRARPCASDIDCGEAFLDRLRPFIWRRSMDAYAVEDVKSIKRQIQAHYGLHEILVRNHDLKLGVGGIREIEFFAQTQQLLAGGRLPALRARRTIDALHRLAEAGFISQACAENMSAYYAKLRCWEHRIQYVDDQQTHQVPADDLGFELFVRLCGFDDEADAEHKVHALLLAVHDEFSGLFGGESLSLPEGNLSFTGPDQDPSTIKTLKTLGYGQPEQMMTLVKQWHHGRMQATRTARARALLTELTPAIVKTCSDRENPDQVLLNFDRFLQGLPGGVQIFSLLTHGPEVLDMLTRILSAAPEMVNHLLKKPDILDSMLDPMFLTGHLGKEELFQRLQDRLSLATHIDAVLDIVRDFASDERFRIAVQVLLGKMSPSNADDAYTDIAEIVLTQLFSHVHAEFQERHGIHQAGFCVLGMGKFGSREMTAKSDLDLVFIYGDRDDEVSDGPRPLTAGIYYSKLGQKLIAALTVPTASGGLYDVDMRLRPSGRSGPLSVSLQRFSNYHLQESWSWELMALTRARLVLDYGGLGEDVTKIVCQACGVAHERHDLVADALDMRKKLWKERHPRGPFDIKYRAGGLLDIEFILQVMMLQTPPGSITPGTMTVGALIRYFAEQKSLDEDDSIDLLHAHQLLTDLSQTASVASEKTHQFLSRSPKDGLLQAFLDRHAWQYVRIEDQLEKVCGPVKKIFDARLGSYE